MMSFYVNGRDVQTYGSQGQQRTTALSLKLAEIDLIHEEIGEYPILLLDDVLSELDDYLAVPFASYDPRPCADICHHDERGWH